MSLRRLRAHAIEQSLFPPTTLRAAVNRLGFVQADPIRSPAHAQDLILRHRVAGYRAGDLDRRYVPLDIEEDYLYAYGFLARHVWCLLHPRNATAPGVLETRVLDVVRRFGETHPASLEPHLGRRRVVNAWGGYSKATTRALEALHYRGFLRIARRDRGIRIYEAAPLRAEALAPAARLRRLILVMANIFAPSPEKSLQTVIARFRRLGKPRAAVTELVRTGELRRDTIDGLAYVWPVRNGASAQDVPRTVRFLAPFDPVIWDRRRFEHLWGWPYRFEAYTPSLKRLRGYYAMPLLWCDAMVGWANASIKGGKLDVELGFVGKRPRTAEFRHALDAEIARLEEFL